MQCFFLYSVLKSEAVTLRRLNSEEWEWYWCRRQCLIFQDDFFDCVATDAPGCMYCGTDVYCHVLQWCLIIKKSLYRLRNNEKTAVAREPRYFVLLSSQKMFTDPIIPPRGKGQSRTARRSAKGSDLPPWPEHARVTADTWEQLHCEIVHSVNSKDLPTCSGFHRAEQEIFFDVTKAPAGVFHEISTLPECPYRFSPDKGPCGYARTASYKSRRRDTALREGRFVRGGDAELGAQSDPNDADLLTDFSPSEKLMRLMPERLPRK